MNVKANQKNRTFTIRVNGNKFRSLKFCKDTFEEDWSIIQNQTGVIF
jgi:hypothetical protein